MHARKPLATAAALNTAIFLGEAVGGAQAQSLSLIMDSVHNFSDELALVCLFLAYLVSGVASKNLQRTANLLNSLGLIAVSGILIWQAIERLFNPAPVAGFIPIAVGLAAAAGNFAVAKALKSVSHLNPAIRLAYIHNLGDVGVSFGPVAAGVLVSIFGVPIFDTLVAMGIAGWIISSTVQEIRASSEVLLWPEDAVCAHDDDEIAEGAAA